MVDVKIEAGNLILEPVGWHKFWAMKRRPERAIEISFVRERYCRAVVEVADPEAAVRLIEQAQAEDASNG